MEESLKVGTPKRLVPLDSVADSSQTPTSKSIIVRLQRANSEDA